MTGRCVPLVVILFPVTATIGDGLVVFVVQQQRVVLSIWQRCESTNDGKTVPLWIGSDGSGLVGFRLTMEGIVVASSVVVVVGERETDGGGGGGGPRLIRSEATMMIVVENSVAVAAAAVAGTVLFYPWTVDAAANTTSRR